ncbi:paired mesoderm homeobox protein 2-like [Echinops telfairi]|uniref:Paired mesoderm homeobox protein 2-like n=1 Tax=Echinops telfairi TaxID=9371 RepID=A0ABM0IYC0_ECHTE|nr:paired mesoderm homeobox protein 2-like [Echinops telfairi]
MGKRSRQQSASGGQKAERDPGFGDPKPAQQSKPQKRTVFTPEQVEVLNAFFERKQYVDSSDKLHLAHKLGLEVQQVQVWFKNRRAKLARERRQNGNQNPQDQGASDKSLPAQVPYDLPGDLGSCQRPPSSSFGNFSSVDPTSSGHDQYWMVPAQNPSATYQLGPDTQEIHQNQLTTQHINHPTWEPHLSTLHAYPPTQQLDLLL